MIRTLLVASLALALTTNAAAQEVEGKLEFLSSPRYIQLDIGLGILYLVGSVEVELDGRYLRCDNLVAWLNLEKEKLEEEEEDPPESLDQVRRFVKEIYAEGNVLYSQEDEWLHGDRLFIDLTHERGLFLDATMAIPLPTPDGEMPLVVRAQELRILGRTRVQGAGIQSWIGPLGRPFTSVQSDLIDITAEHGGFLGPSSEEEVAQQNYHLAAEGNVLRAGSFPVLWIPDFEIDSQDAREPLLLRSVRLDHSKEFGAEVGLSLGTDITYGDGQKWGEWRAHLDWYSKRGPGVGLDFVYEMPTYRGSIITRYQRDTGENENFGPPPTNNRGRLSWWHRQMLPGEVQMDLEFQLFSDRGYYPTWFEGEEKSVKPPENLFYLKRTFFNSQVSGLYSTRFNDWLTRVEHQPELRYDLVTEPLFDLGNHPLYLTVSARGGQGRIRYDDDLGLDDPATWRADVDTLLEYAMPAGPLKITPFAGVRYTFYETDLLGRDNQDRLGLTSGVTLASQAWRTFDADGGLFNLDGLRHVMIPELTFRNTVGVDIPPSELIPLDDVETFDNIQAFEFRLRNLLQTRRNRGPSRVAETFIDLELGTAYYPNPRDNGDDPWGNLEWDLLVRFSDALQFIADGEVNYYGRGLEVVNTAIGYTPSREFQGYWGFRHYHNEYDVIFAQNNWRANEEWMFTAESSYDLRGDRGIDHRLVISRIGDEWVFRFGFKADIGEDDISFFVSFEPRFLFDPLLSAGLLKSEPRLHYLGSGLSQ